MAKLPTPAPREAKSPQWSFSSKFPQILIAGEPVANAGRARALTRWTSICLGVAVRELWWQKPTPEALRATRKLIMLALAQLSPRFQHATFDMGSQKPAAAMVEKYAKPKAMKLLDKVLAPTFGDRRPLVCLRSGNALDVQYEASLIVSGDGFYLWLDDTTKNRARLIALFAKLRELPGFASGILRHGFAGPFSEASLRTGSITSRSMTPGQVLGDHQQQERAQLAGAFRLALGAKYLSDPAARLRIERWAQRHADARVDAHGLFVAAPLPKHATDRQASSLALEKSFDSLCRAAKKDLGRAKR